MAKEHRWIFTGRFRAKAYGWRGSSLASKRLREAVREINKVARLNPMLAAEGTVSLMERMWSAFQGIDTSSGAMGSAVRGALAELLPILISAPADLPTRTRWTDGLYQAVLDDGVQYLSPVEEAWGDICGFPELAGRWVSLLYQPLLESWSSSPRGWFVGSSICLSSLLKTKRYADIDGLLGLRPSRLWCFVKFAAAARVQQGRIDEALALADACLGDWANSQGSVALFCEKTLLDAGRRDEAYAKYAKATCAQATNRGTYQEILRRYPERDPRQVLLDLIESTTAKGKWFAAAKDAGFLDVALTCSASDGADPATLSRAARDFTESDPEFAVRVALHAIHHFLAGHGYEARLSDLILAYDSLQSAATKLGKNEWAQSELQQLLAAATQPSGMLMRRGLLAHIQLCRSGNPHGLARAAQSNRGGKKK